MSMQYAIFQHDTCALFGAMRLAGEHGALSALDFAVEHAVEPSSEVWMQHAVAWLSAYCAGDAMPTMPVVQVYGTAFQQRVWGALQQIPYGETMTYAELARHVGSSARAVGGALRANPLPIFIPCHRVVSASGLGGYAGISELGQKRKRCLLAHEATHASMA